MHHIRGIVFFELVKKSFLFNVYNLDNKLRHKQLTNIVAVSYYSLKK